VGFTGAKRYHTLMPSDLKRYQQEGSYHFITFSCYQRHPYLNDDHSRIVFEEILERLRQRHGFFVFGYVLMPNHVHLLISEPTKQELQNTLRVLKGETSKRLKGDQKQFWQTRYYDFNILTHRKHVEKLKYIHRNPVERGLVESAEDWPWSSYHHYQTTEPRCYNFPGRSRSPRSAMLDAGTHDRTVSQATEPASALQKIDRGCTSFCTRRTKTKW
jgi:putative transposase